MLYFTSLSLFTYEVSEGGRGDVPQLLIFADRDGWGSKKAQNTLTSVLNSPLLDTFHKACFLIHIKSECQHGQHSISYKVKVSKFQSGNRISSLMKYKEGPWSATTRMPWWGSFRSPSLPGWGKGRKLFWSWCRGREHSITIKRMTCVQKKSCQYHEKLKW